MELRHLRYFIAITEEGSFSVAAEKRLHTSQPSLSRQIKDLEDEIGTPLFNRSTAGVELTKAGQAFIEHARIALSQADAAIDAARRVIQTKQCFSIGFLMGQEVEWLSEASRLLAPELPSIQLMATSQYSPELAEALKAGRLDLAFMRAEPNTPELAYVPVAIEEFIVLMPSNHCLASKKEIDVKDLEKEAFIGTTSLAGPMTKVIEDYFAQKQVKIEPAHRIQNITMAISLIASTRGISILPAFTQKFLPPSVVSRPLKGKQPTIDLVVGYKKSNTSPILEAFLSRIDRIKKN